MLAAPFVKILIPALLLTACSAPAAPPAAVLPGTAPSANASSSSTPVPELTPSLPQAKDACAAALPGRTLLGWGATTVGDLRSYRYGPQSNPPPLAKAFRGEADDGAGNWCATKAKGHATAWWGVVDGTAKHVITINGPGEGRKIGETKGPMQVP